ncbi:DUF2163 domain-containing protein [Paraburkholderia terrae]|uniref:DUF2163 domain-containing protein n=1 Tax=Paraburkholderia terrae TaxID=311230 RepID=UPI00296AD3B5|nr:DUF2163 domain-containing protein [Paraburkholderia terrae]MDW3655140.1 DUF2163 domain-containing protein [Paraburkholderia terrae]
MRNISAALLAHLQGDVRTIATLWLITRTDGQVFGFTDLDRDITYNGVTYSSAGGYTHSSLDSGSTLSTSNLDIQAIFDSSAITQASLQGGLWDFAAVSIQLVNYNDLSMGAVQLNGGTLGQLTIKNGTYTAELRGLAQVMQQDAGDVYSPTCRATFGDSKCTMDLAPLTFSGSVQSINNATSWNDPGLTQTGPSTSFIDSRGQIIPTQTPFTIQIVPPAGGSFVSNTGVHDAVGKSYSLVGGSPGNQQYSVSPSGLYTFSVQQAGAEVFIDYSYGMGYFAFGLVKWLTGLNAGTSGDVKSFSPGVVTLAMQPVFPVRVGDTYSIVAGCDRQPGTCSGRWNNLIHFRGEPFIPGQDTMIAVKT